MWYFSRKKYCIFTFRYKKWLSYPKLIFSLTFESLLCQRQRIKRDILTLSFIFLRPDGTWRWRGRFWNTTHNQWNIYGIVLIILLKYNIKWQTSMSHHMLIILLKYFYIWEIDKTFRLHLLTALEEWSVQPSLDFSLFSQKRSVFLKIIIVVSSTNVIIVFIFVYKRSPPPPPSSCSALNLIMSPCLSCEQGWHFVCFRRTWH